MKHTDFRIGNTVRLNEKWFNDNPEYSATETILTVKSIDYDFLLPDDYHINGYDIKYIEGIVLTEEKLLQLEFNYEQEQKYRIGKAFSCEYETLTLFLMKHEKGFWVILHGHNGEINMGTKKYVHEIQNLYKELSGKELILNK